MTFSKKLDSWCYLPVEIDVLPKTKMVRTVHMNIFYKVDLQNTDPKIEFLMKTENSGFQKIENDFLGPKSSFWDGSELQNDFQIFWTIPESFWLNFHM